MTRSLLALSQSYESALRRHLRKKVSATAGSARALGRRALALGFGTLELALIHEQALMSSALAADSPADRDRLVKRAKTFFAEAMVPMESTHRVAVESNARLNRLNRDLTRRTKALASSNRQLKQQIARRQVVERTLRQSERRTIQSLKTSKRLQEQLKLLSRRVLSSQEEERKRISRELHDVVAQVLASINVRLAVLRTEATGHAKGFARNIARTQKLVEKSVEVVHQFACDLRPAVLDHLGLIPALHSLLKRFATETGVRVSLTAFSGVEAMDSGRLTVLYRVAQEALSNVARHAQASRVDVHIRKAPGAARMDIRDNGKSFNVERAYRSRKGRRMGLIGMRERVEMVGGQLVVESSPGAGTTIQAVVPFGRGHKEVAHP